MLGVIQCGHIGVVAPAVNGGPFVVLFHLTLQLPAPRVTIGILLSVISGSEHIAVHLNGSVGVELNVPETSVVVTPLGVRIAVDKMGVIITTNAAAATVNRVTGIIVIIRYSLTRDQLVAGCRDSQFLGIDGVACSLVLQYELHDGLLAGEVGLRRGSDMGVVYRCNRYVSHGIVAVLLNGVPVAEQHATLVGVGPVGAREEQVQFVAHVHRTRQVARQRGGTRLAGSSGQRAKRSSAPCLREHCHMVCSGPLHLESRAVQGQCAVGAVVAHRGIDGHGVMTRRVDRLLNLVCDIVLVRTCGHGDSCHQQGGQRIDICYKLLHSCILLVLMFITPI